MDYLILAFFLSVKLHDRFYDKEERVRMEVVKSVCEVAAENFDAVPKIVSFVLKVLCTS